MATGPSLQHRVVGLVGPGAPLAASLPESAVNAGIAGGALVGVVGIAAAWAIGFVKPAAVAVAVAPEPAATRS